MLNRVHEVRNGPQIIGWTKYGPWESSVHLTAKIFRHCIIFTDHIIIQKSILIRNKDTNNTLTALHTYLISVPTAVHVYDEADGNP